jgi:hypothetical protein
VIPRKTKNAMGVVMKYCMSAIAAITMTTRIASTTVIPRK